MVRRLDPVFDLQSERLAERRRAKGQMTVPVNEDRRITSLARAVIQTYAAHDEGGYGRFASNTETRVRDSRSMKSTDAGQNRETIPDIVAYDSCHESSALVADERMPTDRRETCSAIRFQEHAFGTSLEFEAGGPGKRNRKFARERKGCGRKPLVGRRLPSCQLILGAYRGLSSGRRKRSQAGETGVCAASSRHAGAEDQRFREGETKRDIDL